MTTFFLVPGAWHGSWCFEAGVPLLERAGHTVYALTLTGLRVEDDDATVASANLDSHADDVLALLDRANVTDATLVGHSYAGMVIAAAADRAEGRISRLVHLYAYVPPTVSRAGRPRASNIVRRSSLVPPRPATPWPRRIDQTGRTAAIPDAVRIRSPRRCKRSGSPVPSRSLWRQIRDDLLSETEALTAGDVRDRTNFMGAVIDARASGGISP